MDLDFALDSPSELKFEVIVYLMLLVYIFAYFN